MRSQIPEYEENIEKIPINGDAFFVHLRNLDAHSIEKINESILTLREQDYQKRKILDRKRILIADGNKPFHIHPYEHEIIALRNLKGMLIIAKHIDEDIQDAIQQAFQRYVDDHDNALNQSNLRKRLNEDFAKILMETFLIKKKSAYTQLAMANDIGRLLEDHPAICTRHTENDMHVEEISTIRRISPAYYHKQFDYVVNKTWFQSAEKKAGVEKTPTNWLRRCFTNEDMLDKINRHRVPASPSSRWLPLPANLKDEEINLGEHHLSFVRTGTAVSFDIDDKNTRRELAKDQLEEIFNDEHTQKAQARFNDLYKPFFINRSRRPGHILLCYQSLLSPLYGERQGPHKDNNAAFIAHTESALDEINLERMRHKLNKIYHTNTPVNKLSIFSQKSDQHVDSRLLKIAITIDLLLGENNETYVKQGFFKKDIDIEACIRSILKDNYSQSLKSEIRIRLLAAFHLQQLLNNQGDYKKLKSHQRQFMTAGLEFLTLGSQSYTTVGCKSARDRTSVFAAVANTMAANIHAMTNWHTLKLGMKNELQRGHHARSMSDHVGAIKDDVVCSEINELFSPEVHQETKKLYDAFKERGGGHKYQEDNRLREPFTGLTPIEKKGAGANDPGLYGYVYEDDEKNRYLIKQDTHHGKVRVAKVIGEGLAGDVLAEIFQKTNVHANRYANTRLIAVGKKPGDIPKKPDEKGENIYLQSTYIAGYKNDYWKYAYKEHYKEKINKTLRNEADVNTLADAEVNKHRSRPHAVLASLSGKQIHANRINIPSKHILQNKQFIRDFADLTIPRLFISDFGVHSGNIGVADIHGKNRLVAIDFGAAFCGLLPTVNLYSLFNTGTSFYKNHLLEYDDTIIKSREMARKMIEVGNLSASFIEKTVNEQLEKLQPFYGIDPLKKFCQRLDMPHSAYKNESKTDELLNKIKVFMISRLKQRQASLKAQGLTLLLEHCYDAKNKTINKEQLHHDMYLYGSHINEFVFNGSFAKTPLILKQVKNHDDFKINICDALIEINNNKGKPNAGISLTLFGSLTKDIEKVIKKIDAILGEQRYKPGFFNHHDASRDSIHTPRRVRVK